MDTTVERPVTKDPVLDRVREADTSPIRTYAAFFVGRPGLAALCEFDLITGLFGSLPGAAGFWFRRLAYPRLFKRVGQSVAWGRGLAIRHPGNIAVGDRVGIDDRCLLDAKEWFLPVERDRLSVSRIESGATASSHPGQVSPAVEIAIARYRASHSGPGLTRIRR